MALDATKIIAGPCRVFVGVTPGVTGTPPAYILHTDGLPASGTEAGHTEGDTVFSYQNVKQSIGSEQSLADVDVFVEGETASLTFTMKEHNVEALKRALDNIGVDSVAAGDGFYFGGGTSVLNPRKEAVMLTARQRNAPTKFVIAVLYRVFSQDGYKVSFGKKTQGVIPVTLTALADLTRNAGDQLGYLRFEK